NFYTKHGTDPARAITISIYVIIFFGVFYFFFPSDWDITSKSKLFANYKEFVEKNSKGYFMPFLKLVLGIFISLLNAFTLSLNAFTTLGFGNIPTHGFARYVCILQGFIGWFLLSVFTVAVFNQSLN
uniref:ion channel n=5 Tax=Flavobacterium sp. TaxID=239 RepID=UPI00404839F9